jgi:hypothetical protein
MQRGGFPSIQMGDQTMPAKSKAQQKAAGAALSAKRGDTKKSSLEGPAKSMEESMSEKQLEEFASTKRKGKPEHAGGWSLRYRCAGALPDDGGELLWPEAAICSLST